MDSINSGSCSIICQVINIRDMKYLFEIISYIQYFCVLHSAIHVYIIVTKS